MTTRMNLGYVAIAALALTITNVATVHAATKICDVMPWRCRYEPDGRKYYWSPGRHMPAYPAAAHASSTGSGQVTTTHGWGCGATDGTARGRSWGFPNQASASLRALSECTKRSSHASCHIVSCSPSVHNYDEAQVAWFSTSR
jgi:hypothetical protein